MIYTIISRLQGTSAYKVQPQKFALKMKTFIDKALLNMRHTFQNIRTWYAVSFTGEKQHTEYFGNHSRLCVSPTQVLLLQNFINYGVKIEAYIFPCLYSGDDNVRFIFGFVIFHIQVNTATC